MAARQKAADEINKMFGLNIEVKFREDYREADDEYLIDKETGEVKEMVTNLSEKMRGIGDE